MADTGHRGSDASGPPAGRAAAAARFHEPPAGQGARKRGWSARRKRTRLSRRYRPAGPQSPHRLVRTSLTLLLFLGVLGAAGWVLWVDLTHRAPAAAAGTGPAPAATPAAASRPPARRTAFTLADPFAGTPAEHYADGVAGVAPPAPHAVGRYSAAQVSRAYATVRKMLIAAHLNGRTLMGGPPAAFARLLTATERHGFYRDLDKTGIARQGWMRSTRSWVTSFAPGSTQLVGGVVKVHGTMRAVPAAVSGGRPVLRVEADYLFVYPVQRPGAPATRMRIVERDVVRVDFAHWDRLTGPLQPWWTPEGGGPAGSRCDITDGYVHPQYPYGAPDHSRPSGKPVDPYDQSVPPRHTGCEPITGT